MPRDRPGSRLHREWECVADSVRPSFVLLQGELRLRLPRPRSTGRCWQNGAQVTACLVTSHATGATRRSSVRACKPTK